MTPEELVKGLQDELVERGLSAYRDLYEKQGGTSDSTRLFLELTEEQKEVFFDILKQTQIDTVATFLALLDGSFRFKNQTEDLLLTSETTPDEPLNGDLTDLFLQLNYRWRH